MNDQRPNYKWRELPLFAAMAAAGILLAAADPPRIGSSEPPSGESLVATTLLASTDHVEPGRPFDVLVVFTCTPGWHLYWRNPGDSGAPPHVQWTLPEGFSAGELRYPIPTVLAHSGDTTNVLEGEFALVATVTPPTAPASIPANVPIKADLRWMTCKEICVMGRRSNQLELPRAAAAPESGHAASQKASRERVATLLAGHPRPAETLGVTAAVDADVLVIGLPESAASSAIFVPDSTPGVEYGPLVRERDRAGRPTLRIPLTLKPQDSLGKPPRAAGLVVLDPAATPRVGTSIDLGLAVKSPTEPDRAAPRPARP